MNHRLESIVAKVAGLSIEPMKSTALGIWPLALCFRARVFRLLAKTFLNSFVWSDAPIIATFESRDHTCVYPFLPPEAYNPYGEMHERSVPIAYGSGSPL